MKTKLARISSRARQAACSGCSCPYSQPPPSPNTGTPDQRRACTPDVYRLCAGEIPNVRAITACLRRNKANLSDACRAAFDQAQQ